MEAVDVIIVYFYLLFAAILLSSSTVALSLRSHSTPDQENEDYYGIPCNSNTCNPVTEYCCNESCGICAPIGGFCITQFCEDGETPGIPCNSNTCNPLTEYCCNESCGICAPIGGFCSKQFCYPDDVDDPDDEDEEECVDTCVCPPGGIPAPPTPGRCCRCIFYVSRRPSGEDEDEDEEECADTACVCPRGSIPAPPTPGRCCRCIFHAHHGPIETPYCSNYGDCRLFRNYCNGCNCEALHVRDPDPICTGTVVNCFADPCLNRYADCSSTFQCDIGDVNPICILPQDIGPCEAWIPKWYYNVDTRDCELFFYGGCEGNANNFETYQECSTACS